MRDLDRIDRLIVRRLQNNARTSNKELAAEAGIAPSTALERTRRLEAEGVIVGYHAEVSPQAIGVGVQALVGVSLRQHARPLVEAFERHALTSARGGPGVPHGRQPRLPGPRRRPRHRPSSNARPRVVHGAARGGAHRDDARVRAPPHSRTRPRLTTALEDAPATPYGAGPSPASPTT